MSFDVLHHISRMTEINAHEKLLLFALAKYTDSEFISRVHPHILIVEACLSDKSHLSRVRKRLIEKGYVEVLERKSRALVVHKLSIKTILGCSRYNPNDVSVVGATTYNSLKVVGATTQNGVSVVADTTQLPKISSETGLDFIYNNINNKYKPSNEIKNKPRSKNKQKGKFRHSYPDDFEAFFKLYPRREEKYGAYLVWKKLDLSVDDAREIYTALERQVKSWNEKTAKGLKCPDWKYAVRWLKGRKWEETEFGHFSGFEANDSQVVKPPEKTPEELAKEKHAALRREVIHTLQHDKQRLTQFPSAAHLQYLNIYVTDQERINYLLELKKTGSGGSQ